MEGIKHPLKCFLLVFLLSLLLGACQSEKPLNVSKPPDPVPNQEDEYIHEHFTKPYGTKILYKYSFFRNPAYAVPVREDYVLPYVEFLKAYWVGSFLDIPKGKAYMEQYAPTEIHLQGKAYEAGGSRYRGAIPARYHAQAQAGYVLRFNNINQVAPFLNSKRTSHTGNSLGFNLTKSNLSTVFHEHAHNHHTLFDFPKGWAALSPYGHSASLPTIQAGMISSYSKESIAEDFAEIFSYYIVHPDKVKKTLIKKDCSKKSTEEDRSPHHDPTITTQRAQCKSENRGRDFIQKKINAVKAHYLEFGGIDLDTLQKVVQKKLREAKQKLK